MQTFQTMGAHPARLTDWIAARSFLQAARIGSFPWFRDEFVHPDDLQKIA
jgi:hypothetical protein